MSGIFGIVALDGCQPSVRHTDAMAEQLATRGPEGTHIWRDGNIALGHALLATTPEALIEVLPLTDPESGCTITADCRLDNRDELIARLGLTETGRVIGDGELILRSYLRWGEECPTKLRGDFAFAIWDPRDEKLFCARDHMGMRQLIHHHRPGKLFVFATEVEAVLAHCEVPRCINEGRIADFLDGMEDLDFTSTFYEHLFRLPPAHCLTIRNGAISIRGYWKPSTEPLLKLDSDEAYSDAFLTILTEAIRCRLRSAGPVGAMLSGGLDSGSVTSVAAALLRAEGSGPLRTYSAIGPDPDSCIETGIITDAMRNPGLASAAINHAGLGDMADELRVLTKRSAEPFDGHMTLPRAVYLLAHRDGVKVVLDGAAADVVMSADGLVAQLIRKGEFLQAVRETRGEERFWGKSWPAWKALLRASSHAAMPARLRDLRQRLAWRLRNRHKDGLRLINRDFARRAALDARREQYRSRRRGGPLSPDWRSRAIAGIAAARERYDRVASALGIEPRDPFVDVRLVRFCLSLPPEQLQKDGWPKVILRRAMAGILSDEVRWRVGKDNLGWAFTKALGLIDEAAVSETAPEETIGAYVDYDHAKAAKAGPTDSMRFAAWSETVYLRHWLDSALPERSRVARVGRELRNEGRSE